MVENATKVTAHVYTLLFENERIQILEVNPYPGDSGELPIHPAYGFYPLAEGKLIRCVIRTGHDNKPSPATGHNKRTGAEPVRPRTRLTRTRVTRRDRHEAVARA